MPISMLIDEGVRYCAGADPSCIPWFLIDEDRRWLLSEALGLPSRLEGLYRQSAPHAKQREHIGRDLLHFTFARKQVSQEALSLAYFGLVVSPFGWLYILAYSSGSFVR